MTRIAVTGSSGFIGRQLVPVLQRSGHKIVLCERSKGFDLQSEEAMSAAFTGADIVIHLAGLNNNSKAGWEEFSKINVTGSARVLGACKSAGVNKLIFASSVHANLSGKLKGPAAFYARSKREAEDILISQAGKVKVIAIRLPLVYGDDLAGGFRALAGLVRRGLPLPFGACRAPVATLSITNLAGAVEAMIRGGEPGSHLYAIQDDAALDLGEIVRSLGLRFDKKAKLIPASPRLLAGLLRLARKTSVAELILPASSAPALQDFSMAYSWTAEKAQNCISRKKQ
jgi:nucleoside-diphosphate-sugar epimerase